eukprot:7386000-Prymnesium_polylepis.1
MKVVKRRSDGLMEMGGLHELNSSQRSQLQPSPKSWYVIAPRPSLDMALTLAGNGVGWSAPSMGGESGIVVRHFKPPQPGRTHPTNRLCSTSR